MTPQPPARIARAVPRTPDRDGAGRDARGVPASRIVADAADVIRLVERLVRDAVAAGASDVHVEAGDEGVRVRRRVDGIMHDVERLPVRVGLPLVSRVKILAGLDIADRLRPQDGRARVRLEGRVVELRVSTLPAARGENVVLRLPSEDGAPSLDALGLAEADRRRVEALLDAREGLVLVTGPTGSGKTTTLYAALARLLARGGVNVVTVEDPVERRLPGVVQVQVNERTGLTFAAALRAILRQDPDVVLVGEIRDRETAAIAAQAALTGHLVLATLHTIDAASAVTRLADVGVEPATIAAALRGVVAQRLVRRRCPTCADWRKAPSAPTGPATVALRARTFARGADESRGGPHDASRPDAVALGAAAYLAGDAHLVAAPPIDAGDDAAAGCTTCGGTGYRGRVAVVEVLPMDGALAPMVAAGSDAVAIAAAARARGLPTLWESAQALVRAGVTTAAEVRRVVDPPVPPTAAAPSPVATASPGTQVALPARRAAEPAGRYGTTAPSGSARMEALRAPTCAADAADARAMSEPVGRARALPDLDACFELLPARPLPAPHAPG